MSRPVLSAVGVLSRRTQRTDSLVGDLLRLADDLLVLGGDAAVHHRREGLQDLGYEEHLLKTS